MKRIYIILKSTVILAVVTAVMAGCTKYLDIKPYGKTIPKTAEEFDALLQAYLEEIDFGEEIVLGNPNSSASLECYAENLEASLTIYPQGNFISLYIGDNLSRKQSLYTRLYAVIRDCNIILGYMQEKETVLGRKITGSAYAMRGICYYNLLRDFCEPVNGDLQGLGVPLVTEFDMEATPVRSTVAQTVSRIEEDLKAAIGCNITDKDYKFSPDVMKGYLARLYFWTGDYARAATYAGELLGKYPLVQGAEYKEMIESQVARKGNVIIKSYTVVENSMKTSYDGTQNSLTYRPVSASFVKLFKEGDKDIRYGLSFNGKRQNVKKLTSCMRSAEMQLILAESCYHLGDNAKALQALNDLRRMRISGYTDYTMESLPAVESGRRITQDARGKSLTPLIAAILDERRKELYMEGDRWYELKRNGRPEFWVAKQGRKFTTMKYMYTFPLPISDMELVTGLIQNEGYDKVK